MDKLQPLDFGGDLEERIVLEDTLGPGKFLVYIIRLLSP